MASVLVIPNLLSPAACRRVRAAIDAGASEPAEVLGDSIALDDEVRRALHVEIEEAVRRAVEAEIDAVRPRLETFFGVRLGAREGVSILRYTTGGRYRPHRDRGVVKGWAPAAARAVATVLFLSSSRAETPDGDFDGGALRLFDTGGDGVRDIVPSAGTLVAFPATLLHEVIPVTGGIRDTIVDWFADPLPRRAE